QRIAGECRARPGEHDGSMRSRSSQPRNACRKLDRTAARRPCTDRSACGAASSINDALGNSLLLQVAEGNNPVVLIATGAATGFQQPLERRADPWIGGRRNGREIRPACRSGAPHYRISSKESETKMA